VAEMLQVSQREVYQRDLLNSISLGKSEPWSRWGSWKHWSR